MQRSAQLFSAGYVGSSLPYLSSLYPPALSIAQAAEITGEAPQTIRNRLSKGTYPIWCGKNGRKRFFRLIDVAAFIDQQIVDAPSNPANQRPRRGRPTKVQQIAKLQAQASAPQVASPAESAGGAQ
ncbi:helix-turn-helix domain-containing protein [Burkholderia vietnamiensis]|uniref:helix-turn-helix domain-containing protein n=1 Tax=Burkholderia vietnamiensis TaxID=60552 RepID=UPI001594A0B7|nr:helix-turn-helix domain-containing protein [Burkholderia vietnamiensis]WHU93360.1 helix-turn-helix domain-containing protein [Burkholderia vietnamiensis]